MEKQTGFAEVNGARLYYEVAGSGHTLALLHGFSLDTRMWDDQFETFAQSYRVVRYDARGFGRSSVPDGNSYSHSDDLMAFLEQFNISNAHVIGLSMGATSALDFALEYPDAVDSLVLVDGPPSGWKAPLAFQRLLELPIATAREHGLSEGLKLWLENPMFAPALANPKSADRLNRIVTEYSGWRLLNDNPARLPNPPAVERFGDINAPTLIIMGEHDVTDLHMVAEKMRHEIPNARKVVMMGVGHMANMEDPERFNDLTLRFLASL